MDEKKPSQVEFLFAGKNLSKRNGKVNCHKL